MFRGSVFLIAACAIGEALRRGLALPVSGSVLGIILLFALFTLRRGVPEEVEQTSAPLLKHLSLFFVPAGVGVITQFGIIAREWSAMAIALVGSSILCLLATAGTLWCLDRITASQVTSGQRGQARDSSEPIRGQGETA